MSELSDIAKQALMQPQEAMLETKSKKNSLNISIPKETSFQENRIPLTPLSVALLVHNNLDMHGRRLELLQFLNQRSRLG